MTITWKEQLEVLPDGSVAIEVTVVLPIGKNDPEAGVVVNIAEQLSVAVTLKLTIVPQVPTGVFIEILAGQLIIGDWLSVTTKLKEHVAEFPDTSVAV